MFASPWSRRIGRPFENSPNVPPALGRNSAWFDPACFKRGNRTPSANPRKNNGRIFLTVPKNVGCEQGNGCNGNLLFPAPGILGYQGRRTDYYGPAPSGMCYPPAVTSQLSQLTGLAGWLKPKAQLVRYSFSICVTLVVEASALRPTAHTKAAAAFSSRVICYSFKQKIRLDLAA